MASALPEKLQETIGLFPDKSDQNRFQGLFDDAATAMGALGDLDLSPYEEEKGDERWNYENS